mmetsp:Transcript_75895/g.175993  ORF Transcript_75895/g.175993 Transcript_75895/m.175993 type:complete len:252 (+) Transcript_75895:93-848(+)
MWAGWLLGLVSALALKLSSSVDDVVWLAPFLTSNSSTVTRLQNSTVYITICMFQTFVAMAIAYSGKAVVARLTSGRAHWSTEKILTVVAGVLLAVYSVKLLCEFLQESRESESEEENSDRGSTSLLSINDESPTEGGENRDLQNDVEAIGNGGKTGQKETKEGARQQTLFFIAFVGSVDDLTLFVPMLVGKGFDIFQLALGAFVASSAIVLLCIFIGLCKPIADFLSRVPLFAVVMLFAAILLIRGFVIEE